MSFVGRNNSKITARPSGGGSKLQGITSTTDRSALAIRSVQNRAWGAQNRNIIFCLNQLGGVGRHKSQFHTPADGVQGCDPWTFTPNGGIIADGRYYGTSSSNGYSPPHTYPDGSVIVSNNGKTLYYNQTIGGSSYSNFNFANLEVSGNGLPCNSYIATELVDPPSAQFKILANYNDRNTVGYLAEVYFKDLGPPVQGASLFILLRHGRLQDIIASIETDKRLKEFAPIVLNMPVIPSLPTISIFCVD